MHHKLFLKLSAIILLAIVMISCLSQPRTVAQLQSGEFVVEVNDQLATRLIDQTATAKQLTPFSFSEKVKIDSQWLTDFAFTDQIEQEIKNELGPGKQINLRGRHGSIEKNVKFQVYPKYPGVVLVQCEYTNTGAAPVNIQAWENHAYMVPVPADQTAPVPFYAYQSGSYESRADWVLPLKDGFKQDNYMGMNASDYGGGTPVIDIWNPKFGLAVGQLELVPKLVKLPTAYSAAEGAAIGVEYERATILEPGATIQTFTTFMLLHRGDYFNALETYRKLMIDRGIKFNAFPDASYEPIWCAWGYERNFTVDQIFKTLPKVAAMGYKWAVLDDGYHNAEGDWFLLKDKFPRGDAGMKAFTDEIRKQGLKPKLWWAPLAADPGTELLKEHPDYVLLNKAGNPQDISWWDSYYLCPAYQPVREYTKAMVRKILTTWGFDGIKIDGQHLNGAPPCYNPAHHHARPEESVEQMPAFFRDIYNTARSIKPDAVVEICPCGTAYSFFTMPYFNQPVASDPMSSWQIRLKGKTLKALMGRNAPYYGDHVELSDSGSDFASTVGIGGVVGTKFTWPPKEPIYDGQGQPRKSDIALTPEREAKWSKWLALYTQNMLSKGEYRGDLYDIGYDIPETHAIQKDDRMYYAFYDSTFSGDVELRGLNPEQPYQVRDYVNDIDYGKVQGPVADLAITFNNNLLIVAIPVK